MHPILNIALKAARNAGNIIIRSMDRLDLVKVAEKQKNDFVTEIDHQSEKIIIETIRQAYPDHAILSEETGEIAGNDTTWIIDPVDGTTNYIHGFPYFAVSIGVKHKNRLEHGVIFNPVSQEIFMASRGEGARLNDRRIRVSSRLNLDGALLGTGLPYREQESLEPYVQTLKQLMKGAAGIRRSGAAALDLAYVAAGRLDGFWEVGLGPWDIAAGALLIQEAGGLVSDRAGGENYLSTGEVIAGAPKVFKHLLQTVSSHFKHELL